MAEEGAKAGMAVHGNEYHDPDFEEEGAAAVLVELHRTTEVHTEDQPPAEHGNESHNPDFEQEGVAAGLVGTHEAKTTGIHGVGGSTVESASGAQGKVDTHEAKTTGIHGVGGSTVESASGAQGKVDTHEAKTTGVHGVGANYLAQAPAAAHLVRAFTKGWTLNKLLKGGGVDADPTEVAGGLTVVHHQVITTTTTSVTISSLNGDAAVWYILLVRFVNAYNAATHLFNKLNNDGTAANYYRQYLIADGATMSSSRDQVPSGFQAGYGGALNVVSQVVAFIAASSGVYRTQWIALGHSGASGVSTPTFLGNMQTWTNTVDNITSMVFQGYSGVAFVNSAIGAGSVFTLLTLL